MRPAVGPMGKRLIQDGIIRQAGSCFEAGIFSAPARALARLTLGKP
jgi:hypothetical protein